MSNRVRAMRQELWETPRSPAPPEHVVVEYTDEGTGKVHRRKVFVTEVNGTRTLDLYSGWDPERGRHKYPMSVLPGRVCSLVTLERLWASHNKLTSIPVGFNDLVNLRELFLHCNCLESIPSTLCKLTSLEILWLNSNQIKEVPPDIAELRSLRRLHLDNNCMEMFPEALCELRSLEVLYLNGNQLSSISESIGSMRQLKRLYLQNNKITDIPMGITHLSNIETLILDHNEIRHIRREFQIYQSQREAKDATVSVKHNPCVTPQSKTKLSTSRTHSPSLKSRRHSDQYDERSVVKDPEARPKSADGTRTRIKKLSIQF